MDLLITGTGSIGIAMAAMLRSTGANVSSSPVGAPGTPFWRTVSTRPACSGDLDFAADDFTVLTITAPSRRQL